VTHGRPAGAGADHHGFGHRLWLAAKRLAGLPFFFICLAGMFVPGNDIWGWLYPILLGIPLAVLLWRGRAAMTREFTLWALYILVFAAYVGLRRGADDLWGGWAFTTYPVAIDRVLGLGQLPTHLLQRFHVPGSAHWWDWLAILTHLSYYIAPALVAVILLWRRPERFPRYIIGLMWLFGFSLAGALILPTVPPWLAAGRGDIAPVARVLHEVYYGMSPRIWEAGANVAAGNDVAAMPSLHAAAAFMVGVGLWPLRGGKVIGIAFGLMMALSLIYLGEHYLIDILVGGGTTWLAWRLAGRSVRGPETDARPPA